jgi:RimJ/RimL family protein N-acetyltransferase
MEIRLRPLRPAEADGTKVVLSGELEDGRLDLAVEVDGRFVGTVQARCPDGAFPPGVYEIGIDLDRPERGKGYGPEALRLLIERLFQREGAARVQASTDIRNGAMRRVLEYLGFEYEGVLHGYMPDGNGRADYALYALLRSD